MNSVVIDEIIGNKTGNNFKALNVAWAFTNLLDVPKLFPKTFFTPAKLKIFRAAPPAIIPVPMTAGININLAALNFTFTGCGIVPFNLSIGTFRFYI